MQITFLGTGTSQGVPVIACDCKVCSSSSPFDKRLRSSVMIEVDGKRLIIDAGPDFRQQMLKEAVKDIDGILITHEHKDHIGGLDDVRSFNYLRKKAVDIYGTEEVLQVIRSCYNYAFADEKYPGVPEMNLHLIRNEEFSAGGVQIIPVQAVHHRMPVFGYRIGAFAYLTDLSEITDKEITKLSGAEIVVVAALRKKAHHSHMNLEQALELIRKIKPRQAWLTHVSHLLGLHEEIERELPEGVRLAFDGLKIELK